VHGTGPLHDVAPTQVIGMHNKPGDQKQATSKIAAVTGTKTDSEEFLDGNSSMNFSHEILYSNNDAQVVNDNYNSSFSPTDHGSQNNPPRVTPRSDEANMIKEVTVAGMEPLASKPVKRSKRRENSIDEESSARAERLKAKNNLDGPGMSKSKSFLSFSDSRIISNISALGFSLDDEVAKNITNIKELEYSRLVEASNKETKEKCKQYLEDEDLSDTESNLGLDQAAIEHLVGDIADETLGVDGSPCSDLVSHPQGKVNLGQSKRTRGIKN
jgi:hypothetical protein